MSALKEDCFCRLQLLSTKGVTPVLVKVLEYNVRKTCNGDTDKFLSVFKDKILNLKKRKIVNEAAYKILFPQNGNTDINTWDISLLTCIILNFCTLEGRCDKKKLTNLLEQEAANNGTAIQAFLATNKGRLDQTVKHQISDDQYDQIFQKSGINVDMKTWDFDVLLVVLAVCCTGVRSKALNNEGKQLLTAGIDLSQYSVDLAAFLKTHLTRLNELRQNGTLSNQQYELLFPIKAIAPDINKWDQWLLVIVILNVCPHLQQSSIKAIHSIRSIRNKAIAHASSPEIEKAEFRVLWKEIVEAIEIVIENDVQGYTLQQWIASISHIQSGPLNKQESIDILKEWYEDRNKTNEKLTETNENVTKLQQDVDNISVAQRQGFEDMLKEMKEIKDAVKQGLSGQKLENITNVKKEITNEEILEDTVGDVNEIGVLPMEILRMDDKSIELYKEILADGKVAVHSIRVMVVGHFGVGKTALTRRLLDKSVDVRVSVSTDGIQVYARRCQVSLQDRKWTILKKDTKSENTSLKRLAKLMSQQTMNPNNNDNNSQEDALEKMATNMNSQEDILETMVTDMNSQGDILEKMVTNMKDTEYIEELIKYTNNLKHDDLNNAELSIWDFAGQSAFYGTHQVFLSHRAVYLLVTDISKHTQDVVEEQDAFCFDSTGSKYRTITEYVEFWLNSIHGYCASQKKGVPPVILVGTHTDKFDQENQSKLSEQYFEALRNVVVDQVTHDHLADENFTIDNTIIDPNLTDLRDKILKVASEQQHWGELIPARWMTLEKALVGLEENGLKICTKESLKKLNQALPVPLTSDDELSLFTRFQHDTGNIIYFSDADLCGDILLDPQWLVDAFKCLITAEMFVKNKPIYPKWREFNNTAILTNELIDALWTLEEQPSFNDHRDLLVALMERLDMISRPRSFVADGVQIKVEDFFLVPCMLKTPPDSVILRLSTLNDETSTSIICFTMTTGFIPVAVFNRLLSSCLTQWPVSKQSQDYLIYCGVGVFDVDRQHRLTLFFSRNVIQLWVKKLSQNNPHPSKEACTRVREFIEKTFVKIKKQLRDTCEFKLRLKCPAVELRSNDGMFDLADFLAEDGEVPCHSHDNWHVLTSSDMLKYWGFEEAVPKEELSETLEDGTNMNSQGEPLETTGTNMNSQVDTLLTMSTNIKLQGDTLETMVTNVKDIEDIELNIKNITSVQNDITNEEILEATVGDVNEIGVLPIEILRMDDKSIELYKETLADGKVAVHNIRVMVVGHFGVGKTALTRRLLEKSVDPGIRESTDGIQLYVRRCQVSLQDCKWTILKKDTKSDNPLKSLAKLMSQQTMNPNIVDNENNSHGEALETMSTNMNLQGEALETMGTNMNSQEGVLKTMNTYMNLQGEALETTNTNLNMEEDTLETLSINLNLQGDTLETMGTNINSQGEALETIDIITNLQGQALETMGNNMNSEGDTIETMDAYMNSQENILETTTSTNIRDIKDIEELIKYTQNLNPDDLNNAELSIWDFAGQSSFYGTHQVFLTHRAVYLLVTDISKHIQDVVDKDEFCFDSTGSKYHKITEYVEFWLNSIHGYCASQKKGVPPVILVGTHADKLDQENLTELSEQYFEALRNVVVDQVTHDHLVDENFAINNTIIDPKLTDLKDKIFKVASQQQHWGELIPARWITLEKALIGLEEKGLKICTKESLQKLNQALPVPLTSDEELSLFLRFQHDVGNIIYFSDAELCDHILLDPQWLVNAFKCLITAKEFVRNKPIYQKWREFNKTAILTHELIDALWTLEEQPGFNDHRDLLVALMERLDMISRPRSFVADGVQIKVEDFFLVPCMLKNQPDSDVLQSTTLNDETSTSIICFSMTTGFIPVAVFNRLLSFCLTQWPVSKQSQNYLIYCGVGVFDVDRQHRLTLFFSQNIIQLWVKKFSQKNPHPTKEVCTRVREFIEDTFLKIKKQLRETCKFNLRLKCPAVDFRSKSGMFDLDDFLTEDGEVSCHCHDNSHILRSSDMLKYWGFEKQVSKEEVLETGSSANPSAELLGSVVEAGDASKAVSSEAPPPSNKPSIDRMPPVPEIELKGIDKTLLQLDFLLSFSQSITSVKSVSTLLEDGHVPSNESIFEGLDQLSPPDDHRFIGVTNLLHRAVLGGEAESVEQILDSKYCPPINGRNEWGSTALHDACYLGFENVARILIRREANVNSFDKNGQTPLHRCCSNNKAGLISILIQEGHASVNERNPKSGWIPIHQAAFKGHLDCIKILLDFHSPYLPRTEDSTTPLDLAENYEHLDCYKEIDQFAPSQISNHMKDWFHPEIDRPGAQRLLTIKGLREGSFLIRSNKRNPDWRVLTICHDRQIFNFQIKTTQYKDRMMYHIDDGPYYKTLEHLIQYYSYQGNGLPCSLSISVNQAREFVQISEEDEYFNPVDRNQKSAPMHNSPALPPRPDSLKKLVYSKTEDKHVPTTSLPGANYTGLPRTSPPPPPTYTIPSHKPSIDRMPPVHEMELKRIDKRLLQLGKEIGQGQFGTVVKGVYKRQTGKKKEKIDVAIKLFDEKTAITNKDDILQEARTMQQLSHKCIVNFFGIAESDNHELMLVEEYMAMGSMLDYLKDHRDKINKNDIYLWASQIAFGMMFLEEQKIVHRNLAARHILLRSKAVVKISDFRMARAVEANSDFYKATARGAARWPIKWYAPECMNGQFSHESDVWSFGITLWEMFSYGQHPYGEMKGSKVIKFIEDGNRLKKPDKCPEVAYDQMLKCWKKEPKERPTFKQLNTHFERDDEYMSVRDLMKIMKKGPPM